MKARRPAFIVFFFIAFLCCTAARAADRDPLADGFAHPPASARPHTWWHWMNGNVSREGITADLQAMHDIGLGGFQAFHVTDGIPPGPVGYMSEQWLDLMQHTIQEADRLKLEMCFHNCAGWSASGGPWITPEQSMQEVVWTETSAAGGQHLSIKLPRPQARQDFYRDIAVIAFPTLEGDTGGRTGFRLSNWGWKTDRNTPGRRADAMMSPDTRTAPAGDVIKPESVVLLTDRMQPDGTLDWDAPAGDWTILRFGHTTTGHTNKPAPPEGKGLECNKLDRAAVKLHWDHSVGKVLDRAGPLAGRVFHDVLIDSYEVGYQNWTEGLDRLFAQRVGYDLLPYFPCLTGRVIGSVETTEKFLWDFRRLIADVMAENYFGYFAELCHERGMVLSIEPYNQGGFDYFQVATIADNPMGEFWLGRPDAWHKWSSKLASSAAHALGRPVVGAESFTANAPTSGWTSSPASMKPAGDHYFAQGINRIIFHTFVHQPWGADVLPGMTMGPHGTQMNRNNTWFAHAGPWIESLSRTQFLLQQGRFVADLCYLAPEQVPQPPANRQEMSPVPPAGYDYDVLYSGLIMQMTVKDGRLVLPSGMSYAALVLPDESLMRPELLEKIVDLKSAGASVYAPRKITASPSLRGGKAADVRVAALAEKLTAGEAEGTSLEQFLTNHHITPDLRPAGEAIDWLHRRLDETDIYFIANQRPEPVAADLELRATGEPEIWHTDNGRIERARTVTTLPNGYTRIHLPLESCDSVFIVFRQRSSAPVELALEDEGQSALEGPWTLSFPKGSGAPDSVELKKLISWSDHADPKIKHFSGTATYTTRFAVEPDRLGAGRHIALDLGDVQVMAEVKLNGEDLGLLWKPPYRIDVTDRVRAGDNDLEVRVTNLWPNRLIGDEAYPPLAEYKLDKKGHGGITAIPDWLAGKGPRPPTQRKTFSTWRHYSADDPLLPSGLIGPVHLTWAREVPAS